MEVIGQLAGGVAHDFNNLLTLISGYTDLLRRDLEGNERAEGLVGDIQAATVRATLLTGQLLTVARHRPLQPALLAPAAVLGSLVEVLERVLSSEIRITWNLDPDSGYVEIDQGQLEQLVMNLAINARDAMPGGGWIPITVARTDIDATSAPTLAIDPGQYIRIAVADSGSGMDEETRLRCFEPLYTTKGPLKGTRLGLPAVRRVVLECGGAIRFETDLGRGTTFDVYLPRIEKAEGSSDDGRPAGAAGPREIPDTSLEDITVLLAEDDDDLRHLVGVVLGHAGCRVLEASDGTAALKIAGMTER